MCLSSMETCHLLSHKSEENQKFQQPISVSANVDSRLLDNFSITLRVALPNFVDTAFLPQALPVSAY